MKEEDIDMIEEEEQLVEQNMIRERAKKNQDVSPEMWKLVRDEHRYLVDEFLDVNTHLSPRTKKQYTSGLKQFFWWVHEILNDKPLEKISKRDFMRYMSYLQNRGLSSSGMKFKKSSVSSFNTYMEDIVAEDDRQYETFRNFTKGLQPIPKNQVYDKKPITVEEYELLMKTLLDDENYMGAAWVAVAFNTGARRSEIIQFKTEILDYKIPDGTNYVMTHTIMGKGMGGGKPVEFMVNTEALKYIKMWIEKRGYEHEYVFTNKNKGKIGVVSESWGNYFCTEVLSDIIGRRINPHIFKASAITNLLNQGVDIKLVSKYVAQHEDTSTTTQFYDLRDFEKEKGEIFKHIQ